MSKHPKFVRYAGTLYCLAEAAPDDKYSVHLTEPEQIVLSYVAGGQGDSVYALMSRVRGEMLRGNPGITSATSEELFDATTELAMLLDNADFMTEDEEKVEAAANMLYGFQALLDGTATTYPSPAYPSQD